MLYCMTGKSTATNTIVEPTIDYRKRCEALYLSHYNRDTNVGIFIMETYLRVDDCDYIYYVANLLIIIEIYDKNISFA